MLDSSMTTGVKKYPDFFKVFLPEQSSERMLIPNGWVKLTHLQGRIPEDVILRNRSGRVWGVKTRRIGEKLYFDDGWKVFKEENCLGKADFLVFNYDGSKEFMVLILDIATQCEKPVVKLENEGNVEEQAAAQEVEEAKIAEEEEHEQVEDCVMEDEEDSKDEDYGDDSDSDDDQYTETEEENEEEYSAGNIGRSYLRACKRETASSSNPKAEVPLEDYEFDPEMYIQPENPFFEAKLYKNRRNELHIPGNVIKDFSLTFPEKITLLCCQCNQRQDIQRNELRDYHLSLVQQTPVRKKYLEVTGEVCRWIDGRICIKGWLSFCRRNKMTVNDACLCEIISGEDQIVRILRVHVLGARRG
ncbi:B3 domain-containing protein REM21 [Spatholobus suberectus]|nr:B3 domain-containing protein REM21 [Spatholobus suberectus]